MNTCKFCDEIGFKTNGLGQVICEQRALTGKCTLIHRLKLYPFLEGMSNALAVAVKNSNIAALKNRKHDTREPVLLKKG